ncbi:MAG: CRTAC1 family protein, partial [Acidobacteriota bacterium]
MGKGPVLADGERIGTGVAVADLDGDGDLDLYLPDGTGLNHLYLNGGTGRFQEVAGGGGAGSPAQATGVTVGDYDNDGRPDLYVGGWSGSHLYRNMGHGRFQDVTTAAGVGAFGHVLSVCFADLDHDGDLDLVVARLEEGLLHYRNNGDGTFKEIGAESGLARAAPSISLLAIDLDMDRDVDLVTAGPGGVEVLLNRRDLTFSLDTSGWEPQGAPGLRGVVAIDLHKDGRPDLVFSGSPGAPGTGLWENTGQTFTHKTAALPGLADASSFGLAGLDMDLDGFEDLAVATEGGLRLYRNQGRGRLVEVAGGLDEVAARAAGGRGLQAADLNGDGVPDLVLSRPGRTPLVLQGGGAQGHGWIAVDLEGLHSNRTGLGARVALRSGSLWEQRLVAGSGGYLGSGPPRVLFGLLDRQTVDAVSILWPGGVLQDELEMRAGAVNRVKELDRKGSSCPTLFGWNGRQFAYLADFIGGGALGLALAPGMIYTPDPEELHLVRDAIKLQPDENGRMAFRLTDNLEEVTHVDRMILRAADHPAGTFVLPLEGLRPAPPYPAPELHLLQDLVEPVAVRDGEGTDWTAALQSVDRIYPQFSMGREQGHARLHDLVITFPEIDAGSEPIWLWAHGSLAYSNSSPNLAAAQGGRSPVWPRLEMLLPDGSVRLLEAAMPVPMGVDKPVLVELQGHFPPGPLTLRIRTSLAIFWDRMALGREVLDGEPQDSLKITDLAPVRAVLRPLGFPLWVSQDGRLPRTFDYGRIQPLDTWKRIPG